MFRPIVSHRSVFFFVPPATGALFRTLPGLQPDPASAQCRFDRVKQQFLQQFLRHKKRAFTCFFFSACVYLHNVEPGRLRKKTVGTLRKPKFVLDGIAPHLAPNDDVDGPNTALELFQQGCNVLGNISTYISPIGIDEPKPWPRLGSPSQRSENKHTGTNENCIYKANIFLCDSSQIKPVSSTTCRHAELFCTCNFFKS